MKVLGERKLEQFNQRHANAASAVRAWLDEVKAAAWKNTHDIKERFASASFLADNKVICNIKGNNYRLEITVAFKTQIVIVNRIGTHAEYDKWK